MKWFQQLKLTFSWFWRLEALDSGLAESVLVRALLLACRQLPSSQWPSHGWKEFWSHNPIISAPLSWPHPKPDYLPKALPLSTIRLGVETCVETQEFGGRAHNSVCNSVFWYLVWFSFFGCHAACRILVHWPGNLSPLQWKCRVIHGPPGKS